MFRRRGKMHRRRQMPGKLQITALLDIMTILVFFLLKSYSVAESFNLSKNLQLPKSETAKLPIAALNIAVSTEAITVDGEPVLNLVEGKLPGIKEVPKNAFRDKRDPNIITPLYEILTAKRGRSMESERRDKRLKFQGECIIQADKSTPYVLLEKVLYTVGQVGYVMLNFAALQARE